MADRMKMAKKFYGHKIKMCIFTYFKEVFSNKEKIILEICFLVTQDRHVQKLIIIIFNNQCLIFFIEMGHFESEQNNSLFSTYYA